MSVCQKLPCPPQVLKLSLLLALALTLVATLTYLYQYTPLPVYLLDHLNLRPFFLPQILCDNCTSIPPVRALLSNRSAVCPPGIYHLTVVISFHANVASRDAIRRTWGGVTAYRGRMIRTLFAFGVHADDNMNGQLRYEQGLHNDILQLDMEDYYRGLTLKTLRVFEWIHHNCPSVEYILKTDDDSFNNIPRIIDYLIHVTQALFCGGYCFTVMPDRRQSSKYYVPASQYPDAYYPTYCAGPGYVLSHAAMDRILKTFPDVTFIPMEDVYIAGLVREAAGIHYTNIPGMIVGEPQLTACDLATWAKNTHNVYPERMSALWERAEAARPSADCAHVYVKDVTLAALALAAWGKVLHYVCTR